MNRLIKMSGNLNELFFFLKFLEVIVVTQEWAKDEMAKLPKQYGLDLQLVSNFLLNYHFMTFQIRVIHKYDTALVGGGQ